MISFVFLYGAESWTIKRSDRDRTAWKCGAGIFYWELARGNTEPMNQS